MIVFPRKHASQNRKVIKILVFVRSTPLAVILLFNFIIQLLLPLCCCWCHAFRSLLRFHFFEEFSLLPCIMDWYCPCLFAVIDGGERAKEFACKKVEENN